MQLEFTNFSLKINECLELFLEILIIFKKNLIVIFLYYF